MFQCPMSYAQQFFSDQPFGVFSGVYNPTLLDLESLGLLFLLNYRNLMPYVYGQIIIHMDMTIKRKYLRRRTFQRSKESLQVLQYIDVLQQGQTGLRR
jgi:hypothetical protein